jgi:hypothetical protein
MRSELSRRGGRPTKPAASGEKKIKLSLVVTPETKRLLDAAREQGRTQAEEATRLIQLGRLFENFGRFLLPPELQKTAIELIAAKSAGVPGMINHLMSEGGADEQWHIGQHIISTVLTYFANHQIRRPEETKPDSSAAAESEAETEKSRKVG